MGHMVIVCILESDLQKQLTPNHLLICDPPAVEPLEMAPLAARTHHPETDGPEQPEQADDRDVKRAVQSPIDLLIELAGRPIDAESGS